ncbi:hypothetical protein BH10ACT1_BH10ACT1_30580 [soil metagenome]
MHPSKTGVGGQDGAMADEGDVVRERLERASEAARERRSLSARRAEATAQRERADADVARARAGLAVEDEQVAKLESFSLTRIWAGIRGTRDSDLTREAAEREVARFAVASAQHQRDARIRDVAVLDARIDALGDVDRDLEVALADKAGWVVATHQPEAERLAAIATRRGAIAAELREGYEAAQAAEVAADLLARAAQQLGTADGWSAYDTWFGGGMFSSAIKHNHMDQASGLLRQADGALLRLQQELADVGRSGVAQLRMGSWERGFDVFFDNIFTDLKVRDRVKGAITEVEAGRTAVHQVRLDLQARAAELTAEAAALEQERQALLDR